MKNTYNKITLLLLCLAVLFTLTACQLPFLGGNDIEDGNNNDYVDDGIYSDTIERPTDIPPLTELEYAKYPEKPEGMQAGQCSGMPVVGEATTTSKGYSITTEEGKTTIKFNEVDRWDYVFLPISNFNQEYQNIKITATASNVQKLSIAAVYYEMYDLGLPAVGTYVGDVGDTEQYYIMQLGKTNVLSSAYNPMEETLGTKTVFGLCLFIDSNPSQNIVNKDYDLESVFEITNVEFLKDGDPSIGESYVEPSLRAGWIDPGYSIEKNNETKEFTITKDGSAKLYENAVLDIANYSSAYSAFDLKFTTQNVNTIVIELQFTGGKEEWVPKSEIYRVTNLTDGEHNVTIDFSFIQPQDAITWDYVAGYYVKNYKVTGLSFFLDTSVESDVKNETGVCVINELKWQRMVSDGTMVTKGWNGGSSNVILGTDLANGGIGTLNYSWFSEWSPVTMPIANYQTANTLTIEFQAKDGISFFGVALGCGSFATGEVVLTTGWTSIQDKMQTPEEKVGEVEGIVETIHYDSENKIYTITFDFTNAKKLDQFDGKSVNELIITSLRFYINDISSKDVFEGTREIRFISVVFE